MTRHSKNNTASSVFSYAEHQKLSAYYGTQRGLLSSNSHRAFDACSLCLATAINPVSCSKGHLFCKECVVKDMVQQKENLERKKKEVEALRKEEEIQRENVRQQARERVLNGLASGTAIFSSGTIGKRKERDEEEKEKTSNKKQKFEFDAEAAKKLAQQAEDEAVRQLEIEQNEARKAKLPAFWLPSLTPESTGERLIPLKDIKMQAQCHANEPSHPLLMKHLIPVSFTTVKDQTTSSGESKICPSCKKGLSNTSRIYLMKPCHHVICKTCTDTLVLPSSQCVTCDAKLSTGKSKNEGTSSKDKSEKDKNEKSSDVIELVREGTGFASGGRAETSKVGVAFQG